MIVRIGLDIVEVPRITAAMGNRRFVERILTPRERQAIRSPLRVAGRWAAKEAVAKCVGLKLGWHEIEILNDESGAPVVELLGKSLEPGHRLHVTISHEKGLAAAVAILER